VGLFYGSKIDTRAIVRERDDLRAENDRLKSALTTADTELFSLRQDLVNAKAPQPTVIADVIRALDAAVPTAKLSPAYPTLANAATPADLAMGVHLLLLDARRLGHLEGSRR
jgi:hypothetical protein